MNVEYSTKNPIHTPTPRLIWAAVFNFLDLEALANDGLSTGGEGLGDGLDGASYPTFYFILH